MWCAPEAATVTVRGPEKWGSIKVKDAGDIFLN